MCSRTEEALPWASVKQFFFLCIFKSLNFNKERALLSTQIWFLMCHMWLMSVLSRYFSNISILVFSHPHTSEWAIVEIYSFFLSCLYPSTTSASCSLRKPFLLPNCVLVPFPPWTVFSETSKQPQTWYFLSVTKPWRNTVLRTCHLLILKFCLAVQFPLYLGLFRSRPSSHSSEKCLWDVCLGSWDVTGQASTLACIK